MEYLIDGVVMNDILTPERALVILSQISESAAMNGASHDRARNAAMALKILIEDYKNIKDKEKIDGPS